MRPYCKKPPTFRDRVMEVERAGRFIGSRTDVADTVVARRELLERVAALVSENESDHQAHVDACQTVCALRTTVEELREDRRADLDTIERLHESADYWRAKAREEAAR